MNTHLLFSEEISYVQGLRNYEAGTWTRVEDFVKSCNAHRREQLTPFEFLCICESTSRWYGLGGNWIEVGSPYYVALERKSEKGLEIPSIACGRTGIILGLKILKLANEDRRIEAEKENHEDIKETKGMVVAL